MPTTTAQQRREQDRVVYDAMLATCPTRQVMETIGGKWAGLLVHALADGPLRHGQLRTRIAGVSQKMLTQTLRELERDGLVRRTVTAVVPVLGALKNWSETHIEQDLAARDTFDVVPRTHDGP